MGDKMRVILFVFESFGVRSLVIFVEVGGLRILIDLGVVFGLKCYGFFFVEVEFKIF